MIKSSTIIQTTVGLFCLVFPNMGAAQAADACRNGSTVLMHCTFDDGAKQVALCRSDDIVSYAFGADLDRPELSLSSTISDLQAVPFNRVSGSYFEQIRFYNGDTSYEVSAAVFSYGNKNETVRIAEGRIRVNSPGGRGAMLACDGGSVTPDTPRNGIGQIASVATAGGIDLLSNCVNDNPDPQSCLGIVQAADIRDHHCKVGQDWTDCWAHESMVWQAILNESEASAIAAITNNQGDAGDTAISYAQGIWRESHQLDCALSGTLPFAADGGMARCIAERNAERIGFLRSAVAFDEFDG
ncbi:hypothetical protein [Yoonia sp. 2307UL14-13]|uniref:hypothetical protein n=1 Tax=Yoonia sp. 2307UL14-13 TaxID=3126506 RepID=UPI00309C46FF